MTSTIDPKEIEKFSRMADEWWDEKGKFKTLHKFNPCRIGFLRKKIIEHFNLDKTSLTPFSGIEIIDIGCGGGLISEPFAKMNASLTSIDASAKNIEIAKIHAQKSNLKINYQNISAEELKDKKFDVVFALEIIEHVADINLFIQSCANLLKPNGILFIATINRTIKSLLLAKIGVEYVLRWLPIGTHDWKKFIKPSEISQEAEKFGLKISELRGFEYNPIKQAWKESDDVDVNFMCVLKN